VGLYPVIIVWLWGNQMKFKYEAIPTAALRAMKDWRSQHLKVTKPVRSKFRRNVEEAALSASFRPHRVYHMGLLSVVTGSRLLSAVATGWRNISAHSSGFIEIVIENVSDRNFRVAHSRELQSDHAAIKVWQELHTHSDSSHKTKYEIRALSVPPLVSLGIWLKASRRAQSKVIPIYSVVADLPPEKVFYETIFLERLVLPARQLLEFVPEHWILSQNDHSSDTLHIPSGVNNFALEV